MNTRRVQQGVLVDRQEFVVGSLGVVPVDQPDLISAALAIAYAKFNIHAVDQQVVKIFVLIN